MHFIMRHSEAVQRLTVSARLTAQTNLSDMFVVRPASQILDYRITNEVQDETHYAVTIEAVVGDMETTGCQNRPISHITLFKPSL